MIRALYQDNTTPQLKTDLDHCRTLIGLRLQAYFNNDTFDPVAWLAEQYKNEPPGKNWHSFIPIQQYSEWLVLMLTLAPHVYPNFFESMISVHMPSGGDFPEFGGVKATNHRGVLPTGETIQFIIAGDDIEKRLQLQELFRETHFFYRQGILWLEPVKEGEPIMSGRIVLPQENIERLLFGHASSPRYGLDFPAKQIITAMEWNDVVLHPRTMQQVRDISTWLNHHHRFAEDNNLRRKIKPGYRVLFYGPSGTGKTLTAALLGKEFGKDVYRIDLSQIVSKYIGETEKNLESVFKRAESKDWILFFDEADALFGKRTSVQSSHDKYANQEVSYLLQRVEDYPGLLILASNFKNNLDEAFLRRFHSVVHFPMPNTAERHNLWKKTMPDGLQHDTSVNLLELADQFELTGASILNAVQFATLQSYARGDGKLLQSDLLEGVKKEFLKEEKSF